MAKVLQALDENHSIYQFDDGFSFGTDAVLLSGFIRTKKKSVLVEFGTGTGIIPILLSMHKEFKKIYAVEIQDDYALLAKENAALNGFSDKIEVISGDLADTSLPLPEKADIVFSNPPYMKKDCGYKNENEKKLIARHEIHCDIASVVKNASRLLSDGGEFYIVYRFERMADLFHEMRKSKIEPKNIVFVSGKPAVSPKLILVRGVKGAAPSLKSRSVFSVEDGAGHRTAETESLYETGYLEWYDQN